eukprot:jgi/Botrbrau1/2385/Bobra.0395s0017.1
MDDVVDVFETMVRIGPNRNQSRRLHFFDLDLDIHRSVLEKLNARDLCRFGAVSQYTRMIVFEGPFARDLWRYRCEDVLERGILELHVRAAPIGAATHARFWVDLWRHAYELQVVRWWKEGAHELKRSVDGADEKNLEVERVSAEKRAAEAIATDTDGLGQRRAQAIHEEFRQFKKGTAWRLLLSKIARSGHTSVEVDGQIVTVGGILRDQGPAADIIVVDLPTLQVWTPRVHNEIPQSRFRHTTVAARVSKGSPAALVLQARLGPSHRLEDGHLLLSFGGYNASGEEFGGFDLEATLGRGQWEHSHLGEPTNHRGATCASLPSLCRCFSRWPQDGSLWRRGGGRTG